MTSGKTKSNYLVKFAATPADQELLQVVEQALGRTDAANFSDLCKQALRQMLAISDSTATLPLLTLLEQQIMTLQLQVMQLEQRSLNSGDAELTLQVQQLTERVNQLEQRHMALEYPDVATVEPEVASESPDPLLSRLAPLLEDF